MASRRKKKRSYEFKPDSAGSGLLKKLYLTRLQRQRLLKWLLYAGVCVVLSVIQDVIMSRIRIFGATTDLVAAAILLITVVAGTEAGSLFALTASTLYFFSGSAPGAYVIALLSFLGIGAALFRQSYWHRGFTSTVLCAGLALMLYEVLLFGVGMFMGLTHWGRLPVFLLTGAMSCAVMLPLYPLARSIGKIGGETWKE